MIQVPEPDTLADEVRGDRIPRLDGQLPLEVAPASKFRRVHAADANSRVDYLTEPDVGIDINRVAVHHSNDVCMNGPG